MYFVMCLLAFFFFKQKTAYEMRISDWSSDVCSSDLAMTPEDRPLSCTPEPLQKTARHLEVGSGLVGVEEGRAALGAVRSRDFIVIVHGAGILLAVIARCDHGTRLAEQDTA